MPQVLREGTQFVFQVPLQLVQSRCEQNPVEYNVNNVATVTKMERELDPEQDCTG